MLADPIWKSTAEFEEAVGSVSEFAMEQFPADTEPSLLSVDTSIERLPTSDANESLLRWTVNNSSWDVQGNFGRDETVC